MTKNKKAKSVPSFYITPKVEKMWKELEDGEIEILLNGKIIAVVYTHNDAFKFVHDHQGYSVPWACAYNGYEVRNKK
jgi:hypothetical protein